MKDGSGKYSTEIPKAYWYWIIAINGNWQAGFEAK